MTASRCRLCVLFFWKVVVVVAVVCQGIIFIMKVKYDLSHWRGNMEY
jgi:hypothetical protein